MPNTTKAALEESLKRLLLKKPLDKITITDITTDCGISRMAFYYHFKDIYDLVEWSCVEDGTKALQGKKTSESWTEGLTQIFEAVLENKPFIMNVYRNVDRERIENYLFKLIFQSLFVLLCKYTINCMKMADELDLCNKLQERSDSLTGCCIV